MKYTSPPEPQLRHPRRWSDGYVTSLAGYCRSRIPNSGGLCASQTSIQKSWRRTRTLSPSQTDSLLVLDDLGEAASCPRGSSSAETRITAPRPREHPSCLRTCSSLHTQRSGFRREKNADTGPAPKWRWDSPNCKAPAHCYRTRH